MNENFQKEFDKVVKPVIKFLNDNMHPHALIVIDTRSAELFSGECVLQTDEFINDCGM